jgi:hypothetical protein
MRKQIIFLLGLTVLVSACAAASRAPEEVFFEPGMEAPAAMGDVAFEESEAQFATTAGRVVDNFAGEEQLAERVVIRSANLSIVVPDPGASVKDISQLANEMGGFVVSSNTFQSYFAEADLSAERGSITIRVPSERFEEALELIKQGATEVESENVSGQDVTQEFTDLQSRLRNLEAAEEQLLEIMASATDTEDVLNVFENLRRVREEIEVIKGRIQFLSESARLSAISVDIIPDVAAQPLQIGGWRPEGTVKEAFLALVRALRFLGDAAIWAGICIVPVGLILGLPGFFAGRAILRRRRAGKEAAE